jgi:hypothetical protein
MVEQDFDVGPIVEVTREILIPADNEHLFALELGIRVGILRRKLGD